MLIIQNLVPTYKWPLKCTYSMVPDFIVVHNTANDASAKSEASYARNNTSSTGFHVAVDDVQAVQIIPFNRNSWNAGDGRTGNGNRKGISIEICYSRSGGSRFIAAENNAAELIAQLLKARGWGVSRVKKHQDFSGKYCPHRTLDMGWQRFLTMIQNKLTPPVVVSRGTARPASATEAMSNILRLQQCLNLDGYRDINGNRLKEDGSYGSLTESALKKVSLKVGSNGKMVYYLQDLLIGRNGYAIPYGSDGDFGSKTETVLKQYQTDKGLLSDGIAGLKSFISLMGI